MMDEGRRRARQWPLLFSFQEGFRFSFVLSAASFFFDGTEMGSVIEEIPAE